MKKRLLIVILIVLLVAVIRYSGVGEYFTLENIRRNKEALEAFVEASFPVAALVFIGVFVLMAALSIPGAAVLTIAGGYLFGTIPAAVFVNIGATIGAALAFLVSRHLIGKWVQDKYGRRLKKFNDELLRNGKYYLLTLRLIPIFPFFLINLFAGLTRIHLWTFAWTTSLGIIPGDLAYSFAGNQLNYLKSPEDILSPQILAAFLALALVAIAPVIVGKLRKKRQVR